MLVIPMSHVLCSRHMNPIQPTPQQLDMSTFGPLRHISSGNGGGATCGIMTRVK
jgi:hypothetical protein